MANVSDVTENLIASISENKQGTGFILDGYTFQIVIECQNRCGTEFESPVIISADNETAFFLVCSDCPEILESNENQDDEDDDNNDEELKKIIAHDAGVNPFEVGSANE